MKKLALIAICTSLITLVACGRPPAEPTIEYTTEPLIEAYIEAPIDEPQFVQIEGRMRKIIPPGSLTIDHFIEDLDYMIYVLQNNFALLPVANWAHGVDYLELEAHARRAILAMDEPCEDMFMAIMHASFFPLIGTGHFSIFTPIRYNSMFVDFYGGYHHSGEKAAMNHRLMRTALPLRFYESRRSDTAAYSAALSEVIENLEAPRHHRMWGYLGASAAGGDFAPVAMEILEEDKIALITNLSSMDAIRRAGNSIFDFYRQIQDFEHLIIDMRGNGGGDIAHFLRYLMRPHMAESVEVPPLFYFFQDGPYVRRFGRHLFTPTISSGQLTITEPYRPAHELVAEHYLPEFNLADLERLHYAAPASTVGGVISPYTVRFGNAPAFGGTIWMLTDHRMASGGEMAAWYAKETGVMTLVGDITGGVLGGPRTMALMPNTGIIFYFDIFYITDGRGRPLEAGTVPHYFNRPGMDALETVLALIAE